MSAGSLRAGSILEVEKLADVVQVEEGERGKQADKHCGSGIRAPFQPPGQEPRYRRRPLEERRIAFAFSDPVVESRMPTSQHLLRIRQVPDDHQPEDQP